MGLEVDPDKISLGEESSEGKLEYTSEYKPAYTNPEDKPILCSIVDEVVRVTPTPSPLEDLSLNCKFAFPQVFLTPPIYNPPTVIPASCEDFTATIDVEQTGAAKGEFTVEPKSTPNCALDIKGSIDVIACETFTTNISSNIRGKGLTGAGLKAVSSSTPYCGVDLSLDLALQACVDFTSSIKTKFPDAMAGSNFSITRKGQPDCGLDLDLSLALDVCETFNATVDTTLSPPSAGTFLATIENKPTPECGTDINLELALDVCEQSTFTIGGDVRSGGRGVTGTFTQNNKPDCGGDLEINVTIPEVCESFAASGSITPGGGGQLSGSLSLVGSSTSQCGVELIGNLNLPELCEQSTFSIGGEVLSGGRSVSGTFTQNAKPDCGGDFDLKVIIPNVCESFEARGEITPEGEGPLTGSLKLIGSSTAECGVELVGNLNLPAICEDTTFTLVGSVNKMSDGSVEGSFNKNAKPDCGGEFDVKINLPELCETVELQVEGHVHGANDKGNLTGTFDNNSMPDCGGKITLDLDLPEICETTSFSLSGVVTGPTFGDITSTFQKNTHPDCGGHFDLNLKLPQMCEAFSASGEITPQGGGPLTGIIRLEYDSTPNCGVKLAGNLNMPAVCEDFKAGGEITPKLPLNGRVRLEADGTSTHCGVKLVGDIGIEPVCEKFEAKGEVQGKNQLQGRIYLTGTSATDCGVELKGDLDVQACETFEARLGEQNLPEIMSGGLTLESASNPDCGLTIGLDLDMQDVCETFEVSGEITPDEPLTGTIRLEGTDRPNCGVKLTGNLGFITDFCKTWEFRGCAMTVSPYPGSGNITVESNTAGPDCAVDVCADLNIPCITGGGSVGVSNGICGNIGLTVGCNSVNLNGNIQLCDVQIPSIVIGLAMCCKRIKICVNGEVQEIVMVVCCQCPNAFTCYPIRPRVRTTGKIRFEIQPQEQCPC